MSRRGEAAVTLPGRSLLLLYTDGLVETLKRSFDDGIDLLSTALAALDQEQIPAQICDALIHFLLGDDPQADVALLAIRIVPS